jgi:hypothetical protein
MGHLSLTFVLYQQANENRSNKKGKGKWAHGGYFIDAQPSSDATTKDRVACPAAVSEVGTAALDSSHDTPWYSAG